MKPSLIDRYRGCLLGLACGDAVGTTVEFERRGHFEPVTDMVGGGVFDLAPGQWTDDTSMALCLATSLLHAQGFNATDQMNRYLNWQQWGYLSSTGSCFDIGGTVLQALQRYQATGNPMAGSTDPRSAGNGSLMRLAPAILFYYPNSEAVRAHARLSSATTHAAAEALDCCELLAELLMRALDGHGRDQVLISSLAKPTSPKVQALQARAYLDKPSSAITGSGYCVESLEAALWCFAHSHSFEEAVLMATNLGDDADTTAAITGQLAGAFYGLEGIPAHWRERLHLAAEIDHIARQLFAARDPALAPLPEAGRISPLPQMRALRADITTLAVDAIVNAANSSLLGGKGVDGAIHRAAGPQLLEACRALQGCKTGQAKITAGYRLPARHVIHTVGPVWQGGSRGEAESLASCYRESLRLAVTNGLQTLAFPCISTGVYGYPIDQAAAIAMRTVREFQALPGSLREVTFCCFSADDLKVYNALLGTSG